MAPLSKHELDAGLRRLGELAIARGIEVDLAIVGGAAMVLGFEAREATKDVDVVIRAPAAAIVRQLAAAWPRSSAGPTIGINDAAKGFVANPALGRSCRRLSDRRPRGVRLNTCSR